LFFLRTNAQNLAVSAEISQDIFYGQFGPHAIKSFHLILDEVYGPLLQKTKFPRGTAEDDEGVVLREVAKFSMTMADVVQTIDCRVHFNKVNHGVLHRCGKLDWGQVAQQGDLQHLEVDIAKQWISAAEREIAVEDLTVNSIDDLGPDVTLRHWRERLSHLNSLNEHFQSGETREVWRIWEKQLPHIAEIWDRLEFRLRESTLEATENVKHLSNLYKSFEALVNGTPGRISQDLLAIFAKTKMMRYMSKYLQDDECMTGLLVKVVNQIIARCKIYIAKRGFQPTEPAEPVRDPMSASEEESGPITVQMHRGFARTTSSSSSRASSAASRLQAFSRIGSAASAVSIDRARQIAVEDVEEKEPTKDDIWSQSCDVVLKKIQECIELTHICQVRYRDVKNDKMIATAVKDLPFAFDESYIFAKLVLFEQRLQKLDGFFKAFRLFELLSQQSDPKLQAICKTFFKATDVLKGRPYDVLDISVMSFDFDFDNICLVIAELEQQLQEYIDENFKCIESTEQALDLLSNLRALLQRDSLKQYLSAKYINVFTNFLHDLDVVSNLYETLKEDPPMFRDAPPVTGRIVWIRHLLRMIEEPMRKFQHHAALMISRDAKSIIKKYNQIAQAFVAYEVLWEKAWQNSVEAARLSMSASVLVIHPDDDKLYVNFDSALLQVIREAKCMRPLGIDVPSFVVDIMNREAQLKSHAARLKFFIEEYSLVKQMVVPDLQSLFKLAFDALDDKMRPALSKVTWSSINLEDFIQRIFDVLSKTREIISKARDLYDNRVMSNLSRICHMNLVRIPDSIVTTANFISAQKERVEAGAFQLDQTALQIETAVKDIIDLVLKFNPEHRAAILIEQAGQEVLSIVWNKLYLAVLSCFKVSFQKLKSRIQSSFAAGLLTLDHPFFRVEIELLPPQVKASPSIDDVQQAVNRTALAILRAMNVTPWKSMSEATRAKLFDISDKVLGSIEVVRGVLMLTGSIQSTRKKVEQHIQQFYAYDFLWTLDKKEQIDLFRSGDPGLEDFIARLSEYEELEKEILQIPNIVNIGPLCLSNEMVKFSLKAEVDSWKYAYTKELMHDADKQIQVTKSFFAGMRMQVHTKVRDLDEVRTVSATLQQIRLLETEVEHTFNLGEHYCQVVKEFGYRLSEEEEQMIANARSEWENLQSVARLAADRLFRTQENFRKDLVRALDAFVQEVAIFSKDFAENGPVFENLLPTEGVKRLQKFQTLYEIKAKKLFAFRQGEELFGLPRRGFAQLEKIKSDLLLLSNLYTLYIKYKHSIDFYMKIRFSELAPQMKKMKDEIQIYNENIDKIDKSLLLYAAFKEMKIGLRSLFEFIPILDDLVKSSMRPRHWREIMVASQTVLDPNSPSFCVQNLVDAQLQKWRFKIQDICANSEEEQVVEEKVEVIARQWHAASLSFKSHKQLGPVLFDLPALQVLIESFEEIQALLQSLAVSKHGLPFKDTIDEHVYQFSVFIELMEIWRDVQHVWWYVDVIFSSEDVGKQLPEEAQRFSNVNRIYVNMMLHAFSLRYVPLLHAKSEEFRNTLTLVMEDLEICEKHLAGYLGSKRDSFPRLYYISDKVLIEALSQASGLGSIQGGEILSLFANVTKLVLAQRLQESQHRMIESVQSEEAEVLEFKNPVKEAGVEVLLRDIENEMKTSLQALSWDAIRIMVPNLAILDIQTIASEYPCQACILAMQYWFTNMCESAFSITGDMADLRAASQKVSKLSDQFAMHLRGLQPRSARAKLEAMCVVNMMHQDIVKSLVKDFIKDKRSWEWQCQLKCSIDDQRSIYLETLMYKSPHTYEFVGCRKRLICTAQTNKCYIFLLHTIVSQQFAYLAGPSGCGKTETIHELGRMLGRFVLQFPCSAEVGYSSISNVISGIAQTGSWINLIDLSRLPPEKLSVMAQQLMSVLDSVREIGASRAPGRSYNKKIDRVATASSQFLSPPGIFCSDNIPLAAARANLPDNMRSCVRVLTVLEPDMQVVLFVKLWLACFSQADLLAAKLSTVYKTLASILSDKQRYNFDLRNALTVVEILAHKNKKTKVSFEDEISFAGKVVYDCNEPQMDEVDIPVLHLVVSDVLGIQKESNQRVESAGMVKRSPSIERTTSSNYRLPALIQAADPESMLGKVNTLLIKANLNLPVIRDKCMQAHEVAFVRNGLTFVGGSFTGKSLCCQTLLEAMSNGDVPFKTVYLNPVALGHKHLFGWYDHKSNEWTDGAFPVNWRRASRNDVTGTWLVLDGPINPTWIECLHTCLEDDQTFISANGDRIITKTLNKLVFEVDKLLSASPASLSRTGIIYFPRSAINYKAMITAWLYKRRSTEAPSLELIFEKLVDPVIEFFQNEALSSSLQVNIPAQTEQFLKILESFLAESVLADEIPLREVIERYVLISLAWAFTGLLAFEDRKKVDVVLRQITSNMPDDSKSRTIIDNILVDTEEGLKMWTAAETLCEWTYPSIEKCGDSGRNRVPKFTVPTAGAITMCYLTKWMNDPRTAILVAGSRGVGKSTICSSVLESARSKTRVTGRLTLSLKATGQHLQVLYIYSPHVY
jgi:dynein heavy chain